MSDTTGDTTTPVVGLIKPGFDGRADIREINTDLDLIDARFGTLVGAVINPMTTPGDLIRGGAAGAPTRVPAGTEGQHLVVAAGVPTWTTPPADVGFANPMTSPGDLIRGGTAGAATRVAVGAETQVLTVQGGLPAWVAPVSGGMTNPMTSSGDLIAGGAGGAANRLAVGTNGQVLTVVGASVAWQAAPPGVGFANPMTGAGDLIRGGASGVAARLAPGSANQVLTVQGGVPAWLGGAGQVLLGPVGPGGEAGVSFGSAGDVDLYRSAADVLKTDDNFLIGLGTLYLGPGGDTNLYRSAADLLRTDDNFWAGGILFLGAGGDVSVYRGAADQLKTDDALVVAGTYLSVGASAATVGTIRLPYGTASGVYARNQANTANIGLFGVTGADVVQIGAGGSGVAQIQFDTASGSFRLGGGVVVGSGVLGGTFGDMGGGNLNVGGNVYRNGTSYTNPDHLFELWVTGRVEKYRNEAHSHYERLIGSKLLSLDEMRDYVRTNWRFPLVEDRPTGAFTDADALGRDDIALTMLEWLCIQAFALHDRISALETSCA